MYLVDYGDEPVQIIENRDDLLPALDANYNDPETILWIAEGKPGEWFRTSPFSWFCYVPNSPYRT